MEHTESAAEPVATISARTKQLRARKGWTAHELGERLSAVGIPWDRSIVANLENGRRGTVSVGELLALALVLDTAPIHLLVPLQGDQPYRVTPTRTEPVSLVRAWVRGQQPLPGGDPQTFRTEAPHDEWRDGDAERAQVALRASDMRRHREVLGPLSSAVHAAADAGLNDEMIIAAVRSFLQMKHIADALGSGVPDDREGGDGGER